MLKKIKTILLASVSILLLATACITPRRVNYLQDMSQGCQIEIENKFEATIAPYDELSIIVSTSSTKTELAAPFNLGNTQAGSGQKQSNYLVDVNGDIQLPILGNLHVAGLTRLRLQDTLTYLLRDGGYVDDPFVMVRFNNFKIFFLGGSKGQVINIPNERCTFLEALALISGGIDLYTRRDHIGVMREVDGRMVMRYLDPRSSDVFNDPFFMLQQNDFIIVDAYNNGIVRTEFTFWLGLGATLLSLSSLFLSLAILKKS